MRRGESRGIRGVGLVARGGIILEVGVVVAMGEEGLRGNGFMRRSGVIWM